MTDLGFVAPDQYGGPDIICHRNAKPASLSAKVEAGGTVELQWTEWPESHHGPVIDYLANCHGDCAKVDKTSLKFNKIDEAGLYSNNTKPYSVGRYASDKLIADGNKWTVTIPSYVAPGNYVLRHEIIALHSAYDPNGAQNYPQCINLEVTGKGTDELSSGTPGVSLYTADEPGILGSIYQDINYIIPGPPLYKPGQAESPTEPAKTSTKEEETSIASSSALPATGASDAPSVTSTPASSAAPGTTASASQEPLVSASPFVASGNFSAPAASYHRSDSVPHSPSSAPPSVTPTHAPAQTVPVTDSTVLFNTITSVQTATLQPTPSSSAAANTPLPKSEEESTPISTPDEKPKESTPPSTPEEESSNPPSTTPEEEEESSYNIEKNPDEPKPGASDADTETETETKTPSSTGPHDPPPPTTTTTKTISQLLDLLEKIIKQLRQATIGKEPRHHHQRRQHPRDVIVVHH